MKFLALEQESPAPATPLPRELLEAEAARVWELTQAGLLREIYFRADWPGAVLILECASAEEADRALASLPLVREGRIRFSLIPLKPYPGLARLFRAPAPALPK